MALQLLAEDIPKNIENSQAAVGLGEVLLWVLIGFVVIWLFSILAKHIEVIAIPRLPFIIAAGVLGLLVIGMLKSCGAA